MPFSTSQLERIKAELGYNVMQVGADPYIGVHQIFEVVIQTNIAAEITTTTVMSVAITVAASPTTNVLSLVSVTGFAAGARVFIDVDTRKENVTIQALAGNDITVQLVKAHDGEVPVSLEGPIPLALEKLCRILEVKNEMAQTFGYGALKAVDEIEFYNTAGDITLFGSLGQQLKYWRTELASILGVPSLWEQRAAAGSRIAVF